MAERDDGEQAHIVYQPEELVINADGSQEIIGTVEITGTSEKIVDEALSCFLEEIGFGALDKGNDGESRPNYFSSSNWKAPWNPVGPKPNWSVNPPADPSLN